jgi:hypothetical protein
MVGTAAHAQMQMRGLTPADVAGVARSHALDLRLSQQQGVVAPLSLVRGMIVQHDIAPNTAVGVGLANMYGRKKGSSLRIGDSPARSRKPAVTFQMRF